METKDPLVRRVLVCRRCETLHGLPPGYRPGEVYYCTSCGLQGLRWERLWERLVVEEMASCDS